MTFLCLFRHSLRSGIVLTFLRSPSTLPPSWFRLAALGAWALAAGCASAPLENGNEREAAREPSGALPVADWALYPINRVFDLFDWLRFGVNAGPGFGLDVQATSLARAAAISDISAGVGFQGLRHPPVCLRSRTETAIGPVHTPRLNPLAWRTRFWDVGAEAHFLILGAHVYANPMEAFDFLAGWFGGDPAGDDWESAL